MLVNNYIGRILDSKYKVSRCLGESDRGVVYLGKSTADGTRVSIKFLKSDAGKREEHIKRFFREARAIVQLSHPNIIKVHDVGLSDENDPYLVMEYLEGESLSELLRRVGRLKPAASLAIVEPLLRAVGFMHSKGFIHRDIKPDNIHLIQQPGSSFRVKLTDLGLSKLSESRKGADLTAVGVTLGDLSYISPEQIENSSNVDLRTDLYSIGTIMYEMLVGKLPFSGLPESRRLAAKFSNAPSAPRQIVSSVPPELDNFVRRALNPDRNERQSSADEMLNSIQKLKDYKQRASNLDKIATGASQITIAGSDSIVASDVRNSLAPFSQGPRTPKKKITSRQASQWLLGTLYGRVTGIGSVVLIIAVAAALWASGENKVAPKAADQTIGAESVSQQPVVEKPNDVQIEVRGLPPGAKIYYDDAPIPLNPFRVELKEVIVPLKIEADGYEAYATSVVPAEDQVVKVDMKKAVPAEERDEGNAVENTEQLTSEIPLDEPSQAEKPDRGPSHREQRSNSKKHDKSLSQDKSGDDNFKKLKNGVVVGSEFD